MKYHRHVLDLHPDDTRVPARGDILRTARTANLVAAARHMESRQWDYRWHLTLSRLTEAEAAALEADGCAVFYSTRYAPGEGPADYFPNIDHEDTTPCPARHDRPSRPASHSSH